TLVRGIESHVQMRRSGLSVAAKSDTGASSIIPGGTPRRRDHDGSDGERVDECHATATAFSPTCLLRSPGVQTCPLQMRAQGVASFVVGKSRWLPLPKGLPANGTLRPEYQIRSHAGQRATSPFGHEDFTRA